MMKLPSLTDLNHISQLMHGLDFGPLPGEFKPGVVAIAQQGVLAYVIDELPTNLAIGLTEAAVEHNPLKKIVEQLEEIDKSLGPVMAWFEKSKLYYP
jgi:hypothetical protein